MKDRTKLACATLFAAMLAAGCSKGGQETGQQQEQAKPVTETATPPPAAGGATQSATLTGKINLEGTAPARVPVKMSADPQCAAAHTAPSMSQDVVVDEGNMIKNVFVYVKSGLEGQEFPAPADAVMFDQKGCQYDPHVFGIMVNQPLKILNSDPTLHNIHALPKKGEFNLGMPKQGMEFTKTFVESEVMVHIKCDVHPWMSAWAGVLTHPYHAVTDEHGNFTIKDLPAGTYTIEAWHEKFGTQSQSVTVGATPTQEANFTFNVTS